MQELPSYIYVLFMGTTIVTIVLFLQLFVNNKLKVAIVLIAWLMLQALLSYNNIYNSNKNALPPAIILIGILPTVVGIILCFTTAKGKQSITKFSLHQLTYIHMVRIPVEIVLYGLFTYKAVPQLMTFEGRNFDIIAGITAPIVIYFRFIKNKLNNTIFLLWNIVCLGLLLNIVINALLSAPSPFQQFAFEQPNVAILYFPFSWLPTFIVPIVFLSHLIAIQKIVHNKRYNKT